MAFFSARGLTRRPWFEDFELDLERGSRLVLRAPSGSGKTLLLRALADLDPLEAGELWLDGRARESFAPWQWRARVIYLHQTPVRLPGTAAENVARVRALHAWSRGSAEVQLDGIDPGADMATLSGGEAQRLALGRALALGPDVLLLDEATSALDAPAARAAEDAVLAWTEGGGAFVWVAHDASLAQRLGARELRLAGPR